MNHFRVGMTPKIIAAIRQNLDAVQPPELFETCRFCLHSVPYPEPDPNSDYYYCRFYHTFVHKQATCPERALPF